MRITTSKDTNSEDKLVKKSLARYFAVVANKKMAKFLITKQVTAEFDSDNSLDVLWKHHKDYMKKFLTLQNQMDKSLESNTISLPEKSYFDLKVGIAEKMLGRCSFCNRRCGINRLAGNLGFCECGKAMNVSSIFVHLGEEPELVPSGTVFTMGCTMRCLHCQNWTISQWKEASREYTPKKLASEIANLRLGGCRNANLVGGEPTPWVKHWLETFQFVNVNVPVVWNSNSYYSQETAQLLAGIADVYLLDFKYGPGDCAERISDAPNYWQVCIRNHLEAEKHGELIVRVLVLPGHLECCTRPILKWISQNLAPKTRVNLMFQYHPEWRASEIKELDRTLSKRDKTEAVEAARQAGLTNFIT